MKPRYNTNHNPRSFGFYTKHYSLLPLVGLVSASVIAVTIFSVLQFSKPDVRVKNKQPLQQEDEQFKRAEYRDKNIDAIEKTFPKNSDLKKLYIEMEKAEYRAKKMKAKM